MYEAASMLIVLEIAAIAWALPAGIVTLGALPAITSKRYRASLREHLFGKSTANDIQSSGGI